MSERKFPVGSILVGSDFKPGDPAPNGYLDWHEWAEVQHKAGLRQKECGKCGKWRYPQEMSAATISWEGKTSTGVPVKQSALVCNLCAPRALAQVEAPDGVATKPTVQSTTVLTSSATTATSCPRTRALP